MGAWAISAGGSHGHGAASWQPAGAATIAAALPGSPVEWLDLGANCIGYAGAASLAEILAQTKLQRLSIRPT